jgi:hypothetical protein
MPRGAYHEDLENIRKFREYTLIHAESWYQYANGPCGREIGNGELHLVTGCDKTTSWGIAAYSHPQSKRPEDNVSLLRFNPSGNGNYSYTTYEWDYAGTAEMKSGPEQEELMNLGVNGSVPPRNQCTFIRSLTPAFGDGDWKDIELKVESSIKDQASVGSPKRPFFSVLGATGSTLSPASPDCGHSNSHHFQQGGIGFLCGHSRGGSSEVTDSMTPAQVSSSHYIISLFKCLPILKTTAAHPATYVIGMMLRKVRLTTTYKLTTCH